jgi:hypothetical protein
MLPSTTSRGDCMGNADWEASLATQTLKPTNMRQTTANQCWVEKGTTASLTTTTNATERRLDFWMPK